MYQCGNLWYDTRFPKLHNFYSAIFTNNRQYVFSTNTKWCLKKRTILGKKSNSIYIYIYIYINQQFSIPCALSTFNVIWYLLHSYFNFWQTFQTRLCLWVFIPPNQKFFYHDAKRTRKIVRYVLIFVLLSILIILSLISNTDHDGLLHGKSKLSHLRPHKRRDPWLAAAPS
jgi:hypothetical protein